MQALCYATKVHLRTYTHARGPAERVAANYVRSKITNQVTSIISRIEIQVHEAAGSQLYLLGSLRLYHAQHTRGH